MQEIELKLSLLEADPQALYTQPLIHHYAAQAPITFDLKTTYYDTEDFALLRAGIALRIREDENKGLVQTVKTKGSQVQGLHQRDEFHFHLTDNKIDLDIIEPVELREPLLAIAEKHKIIPLFCTQFARTQWILDLPQHCQVELVLDLGEVIAKEQAIPLQEIELELRQGQAVDRLFELAASIASSMPVAVEDRSKAWKGYQLYQAVKAGKSYHDPRQQERQSADFFLEQAELLRQARPH